MLRSLFIPILTAVMTAVGYYSKRRAGSTVAHSGDPVVGTAIAAIQTRDGMGLSTYQRVGI